jgi:signal transduction histidine kinase/ligand-binding sensor domain-containing protein
MFRRLVSVFVALAAAAPAAYALDPGRASSQYVVTKWGATLPSATIHAVLQGRDRHLWLATAVGLVRFDGANFVVYGGPATPGLEEGGVSRLALGQDGALFLGTTAGTVLQYKDGAVTRLPVGPASSYVTALLAARDGSLWIGLPGRHTVRYADGRPQSFPPMAGRVGPFAIAEDRDGAIWIGTRRHGLMRYAGGRFTTPMVSRDMITALHSDRAGALWIGTPHGLLRLEGERVERFTRKDGLSDDRVTAIVEDRDGNLWVGTRGGLNRRRGAAWTRLTMAEGLSDDDVRCLFEDDEGNLWVGTADGLNCISDGRFITYGRLEGLDEPAVSAVSASRDGGVWIGLESGLLARLHGGRLRYFKLPAGVGREAAVAMREMSDGGLWVVQDNGRLCRVKDGAVTEHTPPEPDPIAAANKLVRAFLEDDKGPIFAVSMIGPARLENRRFVPLPPPMPSDRHLRYTHAAYRDAAGTLWFCDLRGLARLKDGQWRLFTTADGLPHNRVRSAAFDDDGGIWLATAGGLAYFKDETIRAVTVQQGLPENYLRLVLDDARGHLWIASMGRIFRVDKQEVRDVIAGRTARLTPIVFDASDGLRSSEGLLGNAPGFRAADGRLWFGTAKGVSVIDPATLSTGDPAPRVTIERVKVDAREVLAPAGGALEYPPGRGEVAVDYTALRYRAASKLRFRHRLEGLDGDWTFAGTTRRAYYSSLPPGHYVFSVMATNRDGLWNGAPSSFAFTIRPPLHQRPVFLLGCIVAALLAGAVAYRVRVRQVHARLDAVIQERTRIARELHDTLAQGLAGVKLQIESALASERPEAAQRSMLFARSMVVSSLTEVRRSIWVLRAQAAKGADGLGGSLQGSLRQLTVEAGVQPTLRVVGEPRVLEADVERNLLRIAHETVTNAVRHSGAKNVSVEMAFEKDALHLRVRDDGRGFEPDRYLQGMSGEHFGLLGIVERARWMGGDVTVESRPGEGTAVDCRLPYDGRTEPPAPEGEGADR